MFWSRFVFCLSGCQTKYYAQVTVNYGLSVLMRIRTTILSFFLIITSLLQAQVGRELYRPVFHYTPSYNWMSDPNGLVYYNGKYHLFYQYNPHGIQWGNMSWGHAVSTDMINWEEKPVAIPMENGVMIYSGSIVVDWNNTSGFGKDGKPPLVAIYTGASTVQDQRIAYSNDEGLTWTNYNQNPVIESNHSQFRDPKVFWHKQTSRWIMVVGLGYHNKIAAYSSTNLKNWTLLQHFGGIENISGFWECPDLFRLPVDNDSSKARWVLVHSLAAKEHAQYFIGDFDSLGFNWARELPQGLLIADFEDENYNGWTITGNAFGPSPASGNISPQKVVSGFAGNKLVNSFTNGNLSTGKMVSANFTIQKNYISFLIGGGYHSVGTYIKLIVDGEKVRSSTGQNDDYMKWQNWDVSNLIGKTAHIEIVDSVTNSWGHILIDHIIQSDVMVDKVNTGQLDYGEDFYAAQSFSDIPVSDGRRIWIGWLNSWSYAASVPTSPWKGVMSIPREVKLETHNGQLKLVQKPVDELKRLRKNGLTIKNKNISFINDKLNDYGINSLANSSYKRFELKAKIAVSGQKGFTLKFKKRGSQYTEYVFDLVNKEIRFDRSRSGAFTHDGNFRRKQVAPLIVENGFIDFHLFVDNCSAELFASNGQVVMSNLIFPDSTSNKIEFLPMDEDLQVEEFSIWDFEKTIAINGFAPEKFPLFQVYPNPILNSNGLTIKVKDEAVGKVKFRLIDAAGKIFSEFQFESSSIILPGNKIPLQKGLYFLHATDGNVSQTERLVILNQ